MTFRGPAAIVVAGLLASSLTGCDLLEAADAGPSEEATQHSDIQSTELERRQTQPASEYEAFLADCIGAEGFDYLPLSGRFDLEAELAEDSREFQEKYAYGVATVIVEKTAIQMRAQAAAEAADAQFHAMSDADQLGYFSLAAACDEQAFATFGLSALTMLEYSHEEWEEAAQQVREEIDANADYRQHVAGWNECLSEELGHEVAHDPHLVRYSFQVQADEIYQAYREAGERIVEQELGQWDGFTAEGLLSTEHFEQLQQFAGQEWALSDADLACQDAGYDPWTLGDELFDELMVERLGILTK
ncbi:hypothetical protein [Natronoglycomyces albus]|uniref:Lipoprotein n=1 Tax=Natronoglycomyces albus TaxID=2811108 RepID=A0A895XJI3_9ACTN|nr:hypothetical protein [Natronoglycomyces albus]QSB05494.1 hypothetical protein JQS30_00685 [Natronoglycomyces albus]